MIEKKKSLGQHFLHEQTHLRAVVEAAHITPGERVTEIGPGDGALTHELLEAGADLLAIEKDSRLPPLLREKFQGKKIEVVEADALEIDLSQYLPANENYTLIGNIPYYITGALLKKFLTSKHQPKTIVFLIQKEVAERIAREKKESILSLSVKAYGEPHYIQTVPREAFSPPPKVDSAILQIHNISRNNFESEVQEKRFFDLLHAGFSSKRKFLRRNLEELVPEVGSIFEKLGIPQNARAEDVPLQKWIELSNSF